MFQNLLEILSLGERKKLVHYIPRSSYKWSKGNLWPRVGLSSNRSLWPHRPIYSGLLVITTSGIKKNESSHAVRSVRSLAEARESWDIPEHIASRSALQRDYKHELALRWKNRKHCKGVVSQSRRGGTNCIRTIAYTDILPDAFIGDNTNPDRPANTLVKP